MSFLELAKQAEARLLEMRRAEQGDGKNEFNEETSATRPGAPRHVAEALPYLDMSLDEFRAQGALMEVRVRWLPVTLWFVPSEADSEALAQEGVSRGRIWTARELMDLLAIPGPTSEHARTVAFAKLTFGGEVVEVRPP